MNTGYIFSHGWAFDSSYWNNLLLYFKNNKCIVLDQNYYTAEKNINPVKLDSNIHWIGIGHSLGLIKLLQKYPKLYAIVGLQAFSHFVGYNEKIRQRRLVELNLIKKNFTSNPLETVMKFNGYKKNSLNFDILLKDIDLLFQDHSNLVFNYIPTLILYTNDDQVVPTKIIYDNFANIQKIKLKQLPASQHKLGMYNSSQVANQIQDFIQCLSIK